MALFLVGMPVLLLEIALGQAYRAGAVTAFNSMHNRTKGVGLGVVMTGYVVVCYYVPILAWIMCYFRGSFQSPLPWAEDHGAYFENNVIRNVAAIPAVMDGDTIVSYTSYPGSGLVGETVGWTAFIWFCVWLSMFAGVSLTGRAVYFTMGLPIVMLFVLLGRSVSLPNAIDGIRYYVAEWHSEKLGTGDIWQAACGQIFFSIGVGFGYFTTYASYNPRFANAVQDSLIIGISNSLFEFTAGFIVFGIIGFLGMTPENDGQDLSTFTVGFLTYPAAVAEMPGANFWAVIWFLTIACLGVSSAVALTEATTTMLLETALLRNTRRWIVATSVIFVSFLLSLMYCSKFGLDLLDAVDKWTNNITLLLIVLCEIMAMSSMYRLHDVIGEVGMVSWIVGNFSYMLALFFGAVTGQAAGPEAGAGVGFGLFIVGAVASVLLAKTPQCTAASFFSKNGFLAKFWWIYFYPLEQLRSDLNVIVGVGKNWNIPVFWGPILRYVSAPILAIVASFSYPDFYNNFRMNPLYIFGFAISHIAFALALLAFIVPRSLDVFVVPARRNDYKVAYGGPRVLNPIFVARAEGTDLVEQGEANGNNMKTHGSEQDSEKHTEKGPITEDAPPRY
jgi:solute carrier family 6 GABA transporter-like protein 1